jgi:hypothetical protein
MARKYGIVPASDVKIGAERGANFKTGSIHLGRKPFRPVMSHSPGMPHPNTGVLGAVVSGIGSAALATGRAVGQQRQQRTAQARSDSMALHPSAQPAVRSQGAVASRTGGNAPGAIPGPNTAPSAGDYYQAPKNMGAKVPASRAAKFNQGRGL